MSLDEAADFVARQLRSFRPVAANTFAEKAAFLGKVLA